MHGVSLKVLHVEDNAADAYLIKEYLNTSEQEFSVTHESSLGAGLKRCAERVFDVVLLDLNLPDSRGIDTVSRARQAVGSTPIVVMSDQSDELIAVRAVGEGAQDYLVKSLVNEESLARAIKYAIQRVRIQKQLKGPKPPPVLASPPSPVPTPSPATSVTPQKIGTFEQRTLAIRLARLVSSREKGLAYENQRRSFINSLGEFRATSGEVRAIVAEASAQAGASDEKTILADVLGELADLYRGISLRSEKASSDISRSL